MQTGRRSPRRRSQAPLVRPGRLGHPRGAGGLYDLAVTSAKLDALGKWNSYRVGCILGAVVSDAEPQRERDAVSRGSNGSTTERGSGPHGQSYRFRAAAEKRGGTTFGGRAGREDVVDQEHSLPAQGVSGPEGSPRRAASPSTLAASACAPATAALSFQPPLVVAERRAAPPPPHHRRGRRRATTSRTSTQQRRCVGRPD